MTDVDGAALLEGLVEALPLGVVVFDRDGQVRVVNARALELLKLARGEHTVQEILGFDAECDPLPTHVEHATVTELSGLPKGLRAVALRPRSASDETLQHYVAMLGHELRNPLAPLRLAAKVLRDPNAEDQGATEAIDRQVSHLSRLVDDLLDTARFDRGQPNIVPRPMMLRRAIDAALEAAHPAIVEGGHVLETDLAEIDDLELEADAVRVTQALTNLLVNAATFTPEGGSIRVRGWVEDECARVRVEDDGRGIPPSVLESIFDAFSQLDPSAHGGLGLGLGLARRIARAHDGTLQAQSDGVGKGARFTLSLPGAHARTRPPTPPPQPIPKMPRTVLIVDDNEDASAMLAVVLRSEGADCTVVHNGMQALEAMANFTFDVAVVDIGLPDIDGLEVARRCPAEHRPARLVALSGYGQQRDKDAAAAAGFDDYYVKPLAVEAIHALLG